ncbi:MAG: hypothetical protein J7J93_01720 [Candidatus Aenigmarchaeota archaeon]|nr:hypothetical protein [Candidatus Aenigmarchaeota archaeon]
MKYLDEVRKLNLPKDKFAIAGSGPLAIRKLRENNDIDILVKSDLWKKLSKKYKVNNNNSIKIGNIEIFRKSIPDISDVDEIINDAEIIEGIPFVRLETIFKLKKLRNRKKDQKDIKLIEKYWKV